MHGCGTKGCGLVVRLGGPSWWLDLVILKAFPNPDSSGILPVQPAGQLSARPAPGMLQAWR